MNELESTSAMEQDHMAPDDDPARSTRVVILLNKTLPPGIAANAIAHLGLGTANAAGDQGRENLKFLDFIDRDGQSHRSISARSVIVLRGKPTEIRKLRQQARENGILTVDFSNTMTGGTYREQLQRTAQTSEAELEYYGVALYGPAEKIAPLTKRYSLWS